MYNEIMDAVTQKLAGLFPAEEGYTIYTDAVEQGLSEPCFFVGFLDPSEKPMIGPRYYRSSPMYIQFLPGEMEQPSRELNRVLDILMGQMRVIELKSGRKLNATGKSGRIEDGVLTFFIQFHVFEVYDTPQEESMSEIKVNERGGTDGR